MKKLIISLAICFCGSFSAQGQCSTPVLEGFGSVSAIAVYNTYITIGAIADGYVYETYDSEYVAGLMSEQIAMINVINESLEKCVNDNSEGSLDSADKKYLNDFIDCLDLLRQEAEGFKSYALSESESGLEKYTTNRDLAWKKIAQLLDLEE